INIVPSSEREFTHPLLSGGKFIFSSLSAAKTEFKKGYSELFPISPRPPQNYIERIKKEIPLPEKSIKLNGANISLTSQAILVSPEPNIQISITLKGTEILLSTDAKNGSSVTLNIPDDGLVLVEGNLSISGTIKKRLTIVSSGTIRITGDILYLDKNDNHPFLPDFESNSSYSGDSSLALVAVSDILYQPVLPSQSDSSGLKVCALLISLNGSIRSEMSTRMAHLLIYGSRICRKRPYRLIKGTGFADATYLLDPKLAANPPRFAPSFSVPSILCIKVEN
ncbi:MAG: hypothetical protein N2234_07490, partial [Planctomycetota bacterium]|nr:hypothetical protein [Planctomycetota bacterium]